MYSCAHCSERAVFIDVSEGNERVYEAIPQQYGAVSDGVGAAAGGKSRQACTAQQRPGGLWPVACAQLTFPQSKTRGENVVILDLLCSSCLLSREGLSHPRWVLRECPGLDDGEAQSRDQWRRGAEEEKPAPCEKVSQRKRI